MIKSVIAGIIIGVANIIPGVSGGTIIVLLGLFDKTMNAISNVFKKKNENRKEDIIYLLQLAVSVGIGLIGFARVLEILFNLIPTQTVFWFAGLILFSIPIFIRKEMKNIKLSIPWLFLGILLICLLVFFSPEEKNMVINNFPPITLYNMIVYILIGALGSATMIFPGVSGSMVLLIIGKYYLIKSYIANILSFKLEIIIPLIFIGIGILIGIVISARVTSWLLKTYRKNTLSFILGLIIISSIAIIPFNIKYDFIKLLTSILSLLFGGFIVLTLDRISKKH